MVGRTPAARGATSADPVAPTVWLASAASDYVNGQTIFVDGGMTAVVWMSADTLTPVGTIPDRAVGLVAHAAGDVRVEPVPVRAPRPEEAVVDILRWCQDRTTTQAFRAECDPCGRRPP